MIGVAFNRCQGWYHPSDGARAVLICQPQGFEDLCARKSLRVLAERLAAAGMPVLRYDAPGCANADGADEDAGLVAQWRASVFDAAHWLETNAGAREIVVIGLRLGAMFAALEAQGIAGLKGLALLAPVTSGRLYTREMRVLAKIMQPPNAVQVAASDPTAIDVCGFRISAVTETDLKPLSLAAPPPAQGVPVLLMHQQGASVSPLVKAYEGSGSTVTVAPFHGYDDMICDPTASKVPLATLDEIVAWAKGLGEVPKAAPVVIARSSLQGSGWCESAVTFGAGEQLSGLWCEPAMRAPNASPVILLNAGMSYHIGWSRMYVRMARALAEQGIPSLRYDAAGVGDSLATRDDDELPLYTPSAERDLSAAIDWVSARGGPSPTIVGACSGAYTAFHVTRKDERIKNAVIVNLQCFEWTPALGLEVDRWRAVRRKSIAADRKARAPIDGLGSLVARIASVAFAGVRNAGRLAKRVLRARTRAGGNAMDWFAQIAGRGGRLAFVFSQNDPGLQGLEAEAGPACARMIAIPGASLHMIANADHNLTPRQAQDDLLAIVHAIALPAPAAVTADDATAVAKAAA